VHEINTESILFYGLVWAIAFLANFCRCYRDAAGVNFWNVVAGSGLAGFLSFGLVSYVADSGVGGVIGLTAISRWRLLGLSALLGLIAKDPDKIAWLVITKTLSAVKASIPDNQKQEEPPHNSHQHNHNGHHNGHHEDQNGKQNES
jgi:hypothetical protein